MLNVTEKNLPYSNLDRQVDLAGNREFYKIEYGEIEDRYIWDKGFIKKLDSFLVKPIALSKSEARAINEWLDYQDGVMLNSKNKAKEHIGLVYESLDTLFLNTTF